MDNKTIRKQNDKFRKEMCLNGVCPSVPGQVVITLGVSHWIESGDANLRQLELLTAIANFNDFTEGNDPYEEYDFGILEIEGETFNWKINYFDRDYQMGSESPANLKVTRRVLTIMLSSEY